MNRVDKANKGKIDRKRMDGLSIAEEDPVAEHLGTALENSGITSENLSIVLENSALEDLGILSEDLSTGSKDPGIAPKDPALENTGIVLEDLAPKYLALEDPITTSKNLSTILEDLIPKNLGTIPEDLGITSKNPTPENSGIAPEDLGIILEDPAREDSTVVENLSIASKDPSIALDDLAVGVDRSRVDRKEVDRLEIVPEKPIVKDLVVTEHPGTASKNLVPEYSDPKDDP